MKSTVKVFGIIVFVAVISLALTACSSNDRPSITITLTWILPSGHHGDHGDIYLYTDGGYTLVEVASVMVRGTSANFQFFSAEPGTFNLVLYLSDYGSRFTLDDRTLTATNIIPLPHFTPYYTY